MRFFREKKFLGVFFAPAGGRKRVVQPLSERAPPEMDFKRRQEILRDKRDKRDRRDKRDGSDNLLIATSLMSLTSLSSLTSF